MISMAKPIFPPGTTIELRRDMNESEIMASSEGKWMLNLCGSAKRMTTKLSSGVGMSRVMKGFDVSTVGTRWKLMSVHYNGARAKAMGGAFTGRMVSTVASAE